MRRLNAPRQTTRQRQTFGDSQTSPPKHPNMSGSPPPEERKKADAEAREKEEAEQATLPYKWTQTIKDLDITVNIEAKYKGKDLDVKISRNALKVGIKGQEPFIDVCSSTFPIYQPSLTIYYRASSPTASASTTLPGHSPPHPPAKTSRSTSTR